MELDPNIRKSFQENMYYVTSWLSSTHNKFGEKKNKENNISCRYILYSTYSLPKQRYNNRLFIF